MTTLSPAQPPDIPESSTAQSMPAAAVPEHPRRRPRSLAHTLVEGIGQQVVQRPRAYPVEAVIEAVAARYGVRSSR